ncbi:MAG: hypothetical protein H6838_00415 [Planctomycetes bacterium]|nr:hypothetical protein [Planctomycetota bacterium]MCB9883917.1 hypothetical protein [Planctomycetota bacterium]
MLKFLSCLAVAATATVLSAQTSQYPPVIETAAGSTAQPFATDVLFMRLDSMTPTGVYCFNIIPEGIELLLNTNNWEDRQYYVYNDNGNLSIWQGTAPNPAVPALDRIPLGSFNSHPSCHFKIFVGDNYQGDPGTPGRTFSWGLSTFLQYTTFSVGTGNGITVAGSVFEDVANFGVRDPGELGLANWPVSLADGTTTVQTVTDGNGNFAFHNVQFGNYSVELLIPTGTGYEATTPTSFVVNVCGCVDVGVGEFGLRMQTMNCLGRTPGFWRNKNGKAIIQSLTNNFAQLGAHLSLLHVVDADGNPFSTNDWNTYKTWLQQAEATNMSYMLSAHLVAMHWNVTSGGVSSFCIVDGGPLGPVNIQTLMEMAVMALMTDGYTPAGDPNRAYQEQIKNALDAANNNLNWL